VSDAASSRSTASAAAGGALRRAQTLAVAAVLALAALAAWALHGPTAAAGPVIAKAQGRCVAPPDEMRRRHPEMLRHQRDRTVREGVRGAPVSLETCVNCHATAVPGSAAAGGEPLRSVLGGPDQFCQGCHSYAAVKPDCFECHSSRPAGAGHPAHPAAQVSAAAIARDTP
jgi:hypothetical protein